MAFRPRARRLWASFRAERRTLRQGSVALLLSTLAAFVAGLTLGSITHTLEALPGLIILIPASVGMRGVISGTIGARLGTSIHAGMFRATLERNGVVYQNVSVGVVLTLASSLYVAVLAKLGALALGQRSISLLDFVTISVVGGAVGSAIVLLVTIGIAVLSYRRGYDLDAVATPMVTAVGDMVTLPCLFLATFLVRVDWLNAVLSSLSVVVGVYAAVRGATSDLREVRRILLEMVGVVLLVPILDVLAGTVLEARAARLLALPGLLILVPPFVSQAGAMGGILSSRLSSKLQLGVLTPRGLPEAPALADASLIVAFGTVVFTMIGVLGFGVAAAAGRAHPGLGTMVGGTLLAGILATALTVVVSYYVAIVTTRFGLDPDNHAVPLITGLMDLVGVLCLLFAMSVFGVGIHG